MRFTSARVDVLNLNLPALHSNFTDSAHNIMRACVIRKAMASYLLSERETHTLIPSPMSAVSMYVHDYLI